MDRCPISDQTQVEEVFNVLTHGLGVIMAIFGAKFMIGKALELGTATHVLTVTIYAFAWIFLYSASTLYHYSRYPSRKQWLRIVDHCAIFIVIAASYGPYMVHTIADWRGYTLWVLVWIIAILGSVFKFVSEHRFGTLSVAAYVFQGWLVMLVFPTLLAELTAQALFSLIVGGLFITCGSVLYDRESMPFHHGLWHICVLIGSVFVNYSILISIF